MEGTRDYHLSKVSPKEKDIIWYHLYVESKIWLKWTYLKNRLTDIENRLTIAKEEWGRRGMDWKFGVSRCKLLYLQCVNKVRLQQYMNCELSDIQAGFRKGRGTRNCQHPLDHSKSKRVPEKHLFLFYWLCQSLWLSGSQQTVENSESDGDTGPPDLPLEKSMRIRKQQLELDMEQQTGSK